MSAFQIVTSHGIESVEKLLTEDNNGASFVLSIFLPRLTPPAAPNIRRSIDLSSKMSG